MTMPELDPDYSTALRHTLKAQIESTHPRLGQRLDTSLTSVRKTVGALAVAALIFGGGAVALGADGLGFGETPPGGPAAAAPVASRVDPSISSEFSVLSDSGPTVAPMPTGVRTSEFVAYNARIWGLNVSLARQITLSDGAAAWIAPGDNAICLILYPEIYYGRVLNGGCASDSQAMAGRFLTLLGTSPVEAVGVVPNGVSAVTIQEQNGATVSAAVTDNAYDQVVTGPVVGISYESPGGYVDIPADSSGARMQLRERHKQNRARESKQDLLQPPNQSP